VGAGQITVGAVRVGHREGRGAGGAVGRRIARRHRDHVHAQSQQRPGCRTLAQSDAVVPLQLSVALTPLNTSGTAARQLVSALALVGAGQITVGAVASVTVKVVAQVALLVAASVAVT